MVLCRKSHLSYLTISKHRQEVCMRNEKKLFTIFKYLLFPEKFFFLICKLAKWLIQGFSGDTWSASSRLQVYKHVKFMPLWNIFWAEKHYYVELRLEGTGKEWIAMGTKILIATGVLHAELINSLPSFSGFCCKLTKIALLVGDMNSINWPSSQCVAS